MNEETKMEKLLNRYTALSAVKNEILAARELIIKIYENGNKILLCGNGGSASDCEHIAGELMKSFKRKRPIDNDFAKTLCSLGEKGALLSETLEAGLPAISLCGHPSLSTAYSNDRVPVAVFAQQTSVLGNEGDLLWTMTTSGNSENCILAATVAKAKGMAVLAITGENGGKISELADVCIKLPETETYLVQELTLPVYHYLCAEAEDHFFLK